MRVFTTLLLISLVACTRKSEPNQAVKPPANIAEVEFTGEWKSTLEAPTYVFVAQDHPCRPFPANVATFAATPLTKQGALFAEFFVPQGTVGHVCIFAKNAAGKVIGVAAYEKNPVTMQGSGEVVVGPVDLVVEAL